MPRTRNDASWLTAGLSVLAAVMFIAVVFGWVRHDRTGGLPTCEAAGVSTPVANEGTCVRNDDGYLRTYTTVDAGHVLHTRDYDARLLATRIVPTDVNLYANNVYAGNYPGQAAVLISFKVTITNTRDSALSFDGQGDDVELILPSGDGIDESFGPETIRPAAGPAHPLSDQGPIAPHASATGWVSFVAPPTAVAVLNQRPADLQFLLPGHDQGDRYLGHIRLWKAATPQGAAATQAG